MAAEFHLRITTTSGDLCDETVNYLSLPLEEGNIGVLANHAPLLGALKEGLLEYRKEGMEGSEIIVITGGVVSIVDNEVIVLARSAERGEDIDLERALEAEKRARKRLQEKSEDLDMLRLQAALSRSLIRQKAYRKCHEN